ncbi:AraC family transcriptional regulator [Thiolapillus brandeum]|uniref:Transcriptional regulator, AraC family n=1 Tax=Thiolapillus brandeum TaxID=1076588 RepID=A0A7U6JGI9_9GAMM|nr:helix-turn-helix domain-containing protein [Thiolapillus brandeum]BAO43644.1 transcriptional regulator, AraC family [Thiolapillus brandeum]
MQDLAILFAGFSVFAIFPMGVPLWRGSVGSARLAGMALILSLAGLQGFHFLYLQHHEALLDSSLYRALLFSVAPCFYLYSRPILLGKRERLTVFPALHFLPVTAAVFVPLHLALPLSFLVGAAYLAWLAGKLYALRRQRPWFRRELTLLGSIFAIALVVTLLGLVLPQSNARLFFMLYTIAIGLAFLLLSLALLFAPELSAQVGDAARETYTHTTLEKVDCETLLKELDTLMSREKLFRQSDLDLASLAARLNLSRHQLSELVNVHLGLGFSRYLREQRVAEARKLLLDKPSLSVLSVGMEAGFSSQSGFYDAFREITGMTPGKYRELHRQRTSD